MKFTKNRAFSIICLLFGIAACLPSKSFAVVYSHGDGCSVPGAWHQNNDADSMDFLICNGTNWVTAWSAPFGGNTLRLDNNPSVGNAGCLRYNGSSGRIEFAHDCANYSVFSEPIWQTGAGNDIYYNSGTPQVGIGTASPSYTLDVTGTIRVTDHIVVNATAGATTPSFFDLDDLASVTISSPSSGQVLSYNGTNWINSAGGGGSGLWTLSGSDIYYISGNVGIGTDTTPDSELEIATTGPIIYLTDTDAPSGGNHGGGISYRNTINQEAGYIGYKNQRNMVVTNDISGGDLELRGAEDLILYSSNGTERVRISEAGFVGIGDTNPTVALDVVGDVNYTGVLVDVSDIRMKYDIQPLDHPLEKLTSLSGFAFKMKGDQKQTVEYGVSAQEVKEVFPELVHQIDSDGTLGVSYDGLIAPMIESIKAQEAKINFQQQEIDLLRSEIKSLKAELRNKPEGL